MKEKDQLNDLGEITLKRIFMKGYEGAAWTGLIWFRIGTGGRNL
jgi:hypothetical protein